MSAAGPRSRLTRPLCALALLIGLFAMHGAPSSAGGCHAGMPVPPTATSSAAVSAAVVPSPVLVSASTLSAALFSTGAMTGPALSGPANLGRAMPGSAMPGSAASVSGGMQPSAGMTMAGDTCVSRVPDPANSPNPALFLLVALVVSVTVSGLAGGRRHPERGRPPDLTAPLLRQLVCVSRT